MTTHPRWKLWHLFGLMTLAAIYFGVMSMLGLHTEDAISLISLLGLFLALIFEHKMPQWISLIIAAVCIMWLAVRAVLPNMP